MKQFLKTVLVAGSSALALIGGLSAVKAADDTFKVGVVTFLSGGAAESFGVPAWNGGKMLIEMINQGGLLP
ncbi:MAG: ABC transporter substrate-binding protein, partial [Pseudomonadota bacterium]